MLLEAETGEDPMICHDGGFRYAGDFMSMESEVVEPVSLIAPEDLQRLRERGFVTGTGEADGVRVTDAGRRLVYGENA